jgi:outer membrane protein OmpA-like peptidoglycan-associated protein
LGFEDTASGIEKRLLAPAAKPAAPGIKLRGMGGTKATTGIKVRGLMVEERPSGGTVVAEKTVIVPEERTGGFVNLAMHFDVNSYVIRAESIPLLDQLGEALNRPSLRAWAMIVNGHTDSDGSEEHNLRLGLNRALAVKLYLSINHAIHPSRLKAVGYGEGLPLVPNTSAANKQLNRRVEIVAATK